MFAGNRFMGFVIAVLIAAPAYAADAPSRIEQEVLAADVQRFDAMRRGDANALDKVLAPEVTYISSNGRIDDKQSILYGIRSKTTSYQSLVATEPKARVMGDVAVVTGVVAMKGIERQQNVDLTARYMAVYVKRDGRWQMSAGQATQLLPTTTVISGQPA